MARTHIWKFLVNQAGEPIEDAVVNIYRAGTEVPVWVYFDEFSSGGTRIAPQVATLENGYFEFWIDELEEFDVCNMDAVDDENSTAYPFNQKFKIKWEKPGIAQGYVDYIDVFPANRYFEAASLDSCAEGENGSGWTTMNKLISNELACKWDNHVDSDIREIPNPSDIHGLGYLDTTQDSDIFNKILTNNQGWLWDWHENTNVHEYSISPSAGAIGGKWLDGRSPHDLHPVNTADISGPEIWNKVVSNQMMADIDVRLDAIKFQVFTIATGGDFEWTDAGDHFYTMLGHDLEIDYPDVVCYGLYGSQWMLVKTAEVEWINPFTLKISIASEAVDMKVRVST